MKLVGEHPVSLVCGVLDCPRSSYYYQVSSKRVRRIMGELGFQGKIYRKRKRTTNSHHPFPRYPNLLEGLEVVRPDQVWVGDIT